MQIGDKVRLTQPIPYGNSMYLPQGLQMTIIDKTNNYVVEDILGCRVTVKCHEIELIKGENDMKRINKNYYKDGLRVAYEDDYIRIFKQFGTFILFDLFIGKDNLTFEQANEMLKPFGIIIEPKTTDWIKVEVGTKLKFTDGRVYGKITFKEWIEQTQQVIVFNGNKVEVYNEDEVELDERI